MKKFKRSIKEKRQNRSSYAGSVDKLVNFWKKGNLKRRSSYIHGGDEASLVKHECPAIGNGGGFLEEWCEKFSKKTDKKLHVGLLPHPYCGDLKNAEVFILMLNPGFGILDYLDEENNKFRAALKNNLLQQECGEFPFIFLNPEFHGTGGGRYWLRKFEDLIRLAVKKENGNFEKALQFLSKMIATIELFPYHSQSAPPISSVKRNQPESVKAAIDFVKHGLIKKARKEGRLVIVARGGRYWGKANVSKGQSFSLSMRSRPGRKVACFLWRNDKEFLGKIKKMTTC